MLFAESGVVMLIRHQIVGWGSGLYDPARTIWNLRNPMRRDTVTIPSLSCIVLRWMADNPGVWTCELELLLSAVE